MPAEVFDDDYLYFYEKRLSGEQSDREAALIARLLELLQMGCRVVGLPTGGAGH